MSTQLTLIPFGPSHDSSHSHSHTLLGPIEPTAELAGVLEDIQARHGRDVPLSFNTYLCVDDDDHPTHYGNTQQDDYGNPLKHVRVTHLLELMPNGFRPTMIEESWLAPSAWAYLSHLPSAWRVALYWR